MECSDRNCPVHGNLATRGMILEGEVVSDKMQDTVVVKRERLVKVKKYDRYMKSTSRIPAHNPPCINAKQGDKVTIMECRKLSKTVSFVVVGKAGSEPAAESPEKKTKKKTKRKKAKKASKKGVNDG
ncbi:MAG: 30S ribosomal protein S17 [Candidatus Altiarchaeales archaeon]|nr:30S ribosomal protein S17 [Candidatus Altiarchaeales archaeon]MBD3416344.1 30S ribosomal protein S17 [Candidatus Altiarchaeales archaeon]